MKKKMMALGLTGILGIAGLVGISSSKSFADSSDNNLSSTETFDYVQATAKELAENTVPSIDPKDYTEEELFAMDMMVDIEEESHEDALKRANKLEKKYGVNKSSKTSSNKKLNSQSL